MTDHQHIVFDCELIGSTKPVFLVCARNLETGQQYSFWYHKRGDMQKLWTLLCDQGLTWISFNGYKFDMPLIAAALHGFTPLELKPIAQSIIDENSQPWMTAQRWHFSLDQLAHVDHIDLIETAPGVMISLKTYAGRMGYPTMVDMPFEHDQDLKPRELKVLERYCLNDLGVTEALYGRLKTELELRAVMSEEYDVDLRSKSDAQVAEAIFKKQLDIKGRVDKFVPSFVTYEAPDLIQTDSVVINNLISAFEGEHFAINRANGSPVEAEWMAEPIQIGQGLYKVGLGGLHSQHDQNLYVEAHEKLMVSDFDVASYYPNIIMKVGLVPNFGGGRGQRFLDEYQAIYHRRMRAKRAGDKKVANSLKITLNGTFGKLGSIYSAFYAPDLMIAVTITGQLNLLCLIHELEKIKNVRVLSANTDGIMVAYPPSKSHSVEKVFRMNAKRTGFEYEETPYFKVGMKDVNNYLAVVADYYLPDAPPRVAIDKAGNPIVKSKGLYAETSLMKNPTMEVCSKMARDYLLYGWRPEEAIAQYTDIRDFVAIRNVKGGGIQFDKYVEQDDWVCINDVGTKDNEWESQTLGKIVKRKSRPAPFEVGIGGKPFGRVARWYMTVDELPPLSYMTSGNRVPKTEGARVCMTLPDALPADLDFDWYIRETYRMLEDMGVRVEHDYALAA